MGRTTIYTQYIETEIEIRTYECKLNGYKKQLSRLLNRITPKSLSGIAYDRPPVQAISYHSDIDDILSVADITDKIQITEMLLNDSKESLRELKGILDEASKRLRNSREIDVFRLARENIENSVIAEKLGYEIRTIEQTQWIINTYIREIQNNTM